MSADVDNLALVTQHDIPPQYQKRFILEQRTQWRREMRRRERHPDHPLEGIASKPLSLLYPEDPVELTRRFGIITIALIRMTQNMLEMTAEALCKAYEFEPVWHDEASVRVIKLAGEESEPAYVIRLPHAMLEYDAVGQLVPELLSQIDHAGHTAFGALADTGHLSVDVADTIRRVRQWTVDQGPPLSEVTT